MNRLKFTPKNFSNFFILLVLFATLIKSKPFLEEKIIYTYANKINDKTECLCVETLTMNPSSYSVAIGSSVTLRCDTIDMDVSEVQWLFYDSSSVTFIYTDSNYGSTLYDSRFTVNFIVSGTSLTTYLTISSVKQTDYSFTYACKCNTKTTYCFLNSRIATATLVASTAASSIFTFIFIIKNYWKLIPMNK